jgi:hypothetical protein
MAVWRYQDCVSVFTVGGVERQVKIHWVEYKRNKDNVEFDYYEFLDGLPPVELDPEEVESEAIENSTHYLRWNHG